MKKIICLLFLFIFSFVFISCDENNPVIDDIYYEVKFIIDTKEEVKKVKENTKVPKPVDPEKDGFEFIGWYTDDTLYDFNSLVTKDITIIAKFNELKPMLEINVLDNKLNMGYSTQINAKFYNTEEVSLKYKVDQKSIVYIDDKGLITALRPGVVKITAYTETLVSNEIEIEVLDEVINEDNKIDLKGYTIKHGVYELDKEYLRKSSSTKLYFYRKSLLHFIENLENEYNFKLQYKEYIATPFSQLDFTPSTCDLQGYKHLEYYVDNNMVYDTTDLFMKYKNKYPLLLSNYNALCGRMYDKIYQVYFSGFSQYQALYYHLNALEKLGISDPIDLYLEGKWTYSNFINWCNEAKNIIDKKKNEHDKEYDRYTDYNYVISGSEYLWYYGLMGTVNKTVINPITRDIQFESTESQNIKQLFNYLVNNNLKSPYDYDYNSALLNAIPSQELPYFYGFTNSDAKVGIIPYPYPDDYNPKDVKFTSIASSYCLFPNGNKSKYPEGIEFEDIFAIVCEIYNYSYLLLSLDEEQKLEYLNEGTGCKEEKNLKIFTNLTGEDYIYDPFMYFDNFYHTKVFPNTIIENYFYNDDYQEFDNYKNFINQYKIIYTELNID